MSVALRPCLDYILGSLGVVSFLLGTIFFIVVIEDFADDVGDVRGRHEDAFEVVRCLHVNR